MQTSTHLVTVGDTEVRKEFVADHEAEAERACLTLLAEHAPGLAPRPLRREDGQTPVVVVDADHVEHLGSRLPGVYDDRALAAAVRLDARDQAAHFMALVGHH